MLFMYLGMSGCSWLQTTSEISPADTIPLLKPIGPARHIVQSITAQWQGHQDDLLCVLELGQNRIAMAGLTPQGMSLFNLSYDGKKVSVTQSPLLPKQLPPETIVKDLQLAYWPVLMLQNELLASWRITATDKQRRLFFTDQLVAEVNFLQPDPAWPKSIELINHRYHYRLLINTVSYEIISK